MSLNRHKRSYKVINYNVIAALRITGLTEKTEAIRELRYVIKQTLKLQQLKVTLFGDRYLRIYLFESDTIIYINRVL